MKAVVEINGKSYQVEFGRDIEVLVTPLLSSEKLRYNTDFHDQLVKWFKSLGYEYDFLGLGSRKNDGHTTYELASRSSCLCSVDEDLANILLENKEVLLSLKGILLTHQSAFIRKLAETM